MHRTCLVLLAICLQANDIRISEVMANPQGSEYENEFVEIYNASDHVMQINGWILSDGSGVDTLAHLSGPIGINPDHYALILDPSYDFLMGPYLDFLNDTLSVYTISTDNSFGSGGLSNSGESVYVFSPDSTVFSQMSWNSSTQNGYSWERVSNATEDSLSVWLESLSLNGTPGFRNSVTPARYNLGLMDVWVEIAELGLPVEIRLQIKNLGENTIPRFSVNIYRDENQNGVQNPDEWEIIYTQEISVEPQQVIELPLQLFELSPGVHLLEVNVHADLDEVTGDDSLECTVIGPYPSNCISITEVMYSPSTDQQGEWVEVQSRSDQPISLQGWTLSDANQTRHTISDEILFVEPFEYLTLCTNSNIMNYFDLAGEEVLELGSWPALNSSSDSIRLFDATGHRVTGSFYRGSWGRPGTSLERRNPDTHPQDQINWRSSLQMDGGTPSSINTQYLLPFEIQIQSVQIHTPEIAGPTQASIMVTFQNLGMQNLHALEIESDADIFWEGDLPSFESDSLEFTSFMLWPGYNVIPIRILHDSEIVADTSVQVVLGYPPGQIAINEIHCKPNDEQVEFLEFVNTSSSTINLKGWSFRDRSGTEGHMVADLFVQPDSLFCWSENVMALSEWISSTAQIGELSVWPSLNNTSDSILVLDPVGRRMLSLEYLVPGNLQTGQSLERVALWKPQDLSTSWAVCEDPTGMTPGRQNSTRIPPQNLAIEELIIADTIFWEGDPFILQSVIVNRGNDRAENTLLSVDITRNGTQIENQESYLPDIHAGDTLFWTTELLASASGWLSITVNVQYPDDEIPEDDRLTKALFVSSYSSPLVLNEVMFLPELNQSEWIEIFNRSGETVDLWGWSIADKSGVETSISDSSLQLETYKYIVITGEPDHLPENLRIQATDHFPTLNNSEETILLFDPLGIPMDELNYDANTETAAGRSLERIRTYTTNQINENWGVCIDPLGSTPGAENSIFLDVLAADIRVDLNPNPFSPNGDGQADLLSIQYELPFEQGLMTVMIFDMAGRKIAEPVQVKPVSHRGLVWWDGATMYGGSAATGLYIMRLLFDDQSGKVWSRFRKIYLIR